ncbi:galactokinase [Poriferisphaera corsica]|nr:galactokinase [Poriferisphaera corsica]
MTANAMIQAQLSSLCDQFSTFFKEAPTHAAIAPGRVNLIGEHTDYNDGFVLPMAIERQTLMVASFRDDDQVHLKSTAFDEKAIFSLSSNIPTGEPTWSNYLRGPISYCLEKGITPPSGFNVLLDSTVPGGGGLSSSASLEVAMATLVETLADKNLDPVQKALICQKAEHIYAGTPCGIMDQFISAMGQEGSALLIDCRSHETTPVKLDDPNIVIIITNSNKAHELSGGEYAERREQCESAARTLGVKALRDATLDQLKDAREKLDPVTYRRALHIITENQRTLEAASVLNNGNFLAMGPLMFASHESMKNDFEITTPELDLLVTLAADMAEQGVIGSRMTGGGFGGCTVTLAYAEYAMPIMKSLCTRYREQTGIEPSAFITRPAAGARPLTVTQYTSM